jgi:hypothetical protein
MFSSRLLCFHSAQRSAQRFGDNFKRVPSNDDIDVFDQASATIKICECSPDIFYLLQMSAKNVASLRNNLYSEQSSSALRGHIFHLQ